MGFESYNLDLKILSGFEKGQIKDVFIDMNYKAIDEYILEKSLECGFVEVWIADDGISIRTAKANSEQTVVEIIKDIKALNEIIEISIFDFQLKQELTLEKMNLLLEKFNLLRNEFYTFFPNIQYPIRCEDVFR